MNSYTPKHLRRGGTGRNGTVGVEKKKAFRKVKMTSDLYIHLSASRLQKADVAHGYADWCEKADRGTLRAGKGA